VMAMLARWALMHLVGVALTDAMRGPWLPLRE
jgi:hypothetical protein